MDMTLVNNIDPWEKVFSEMQSGIPMPETNKKQEKPKEDPWSKVAKEENVPEESGIKSTFRWLMQPVQGFLATTPPGIAASFWQLLGNGEAFDPEEIERLKNISEREGVPFDEDKYLEAAETALKYVPSVSNIGREIEEKTGLPLEPKTRGQKALRFFTEATRFSPGRGSQLKSLKEPGTFRGMKTELPRPVLGAGVTGVKEVLEEMGVPFAEQLAFGILKQAPEGGPSLRIGTKKKTSGLTERRYEGISKPTEISGGKLKQINQKVENEFRNIASDIIEKSPIEETYTALKTDSGFKEAAREGLKKAKELSAEIPGTFKTQDLMKRLVDNVKTQKHKGITPSEFDAQHAKFIKQFIKDTKLKEMTTLQMVEQYRKNNSSLQELYEPGQSYAYNRAKREAVLDYNKAIAEMIDQSHPDTEFANLFKSTNEKWTKIMDAEAINKFVDSLFDGKIKFSEGKDFFDKQGMTVPFKRSLGEKGFKDFKQLTHDLLTKEQAHKMLKVAESQGYYDLAKTGLTYLVSPKAGAAKTIYDIGKFTARKAWEALLDKPKLAVTWDKGIKEFKKGNFAEAEKQFKILQGEIEEAPKTTPPFKEEAPIEVKGEKIEPKEMQSPEPKELEYKPKKENKEVKKPEQPIPKKSKPVKKKSEEAKVTKEHAYTKEDFPTVKEAKDYLEHLQKEELKRYNHLINKNIKPSSDKIYKNLERDIDNLEKLVKDLKLDSKKITEQVQKKMTDVKRQDISKEGLKQQKNYLINEITDALGNPPSTDKVTFDVPGDGIFKIHNNPNSLQKFLDAVNKKWPDKADKSGKPKQTYVKKLTAEELEEMRVK